MSAAAFKHSVSFVQARKWNDRAAEMLKDPDAFFAKAVEETRHGNKRVGKPARRKRRSLWGRGSK